MPATAASANGTAVFFWLFALLALGGALAMITRKNAVAAVMCLVGTVISLAALFAMLYAHFLAAIQVLVYAGAVMVLFLFVIMLLNPAVLEGRRLAWWGLGSLAALLLLFELVPLLLDSSGPASGQGSAGAGFGSPEMLAQSLFYDFVLPFEIASVLLLVAIIGAVVLAKREL